jgi:hypothetical protein
MRPFRLFALSLAIVASLAAPRAHAQCLGPCPGAGQPCYQTSNVPPVIVGGGSCVGGVTAVPFKVVVRDATGLPLAGVRVVIDFSTVVGPTHGNQLQFPSQQALCPNAWLVRSTDATGTATFYPQFFGCVTGPVIQVTGNGFCLGFVEARSTDVQMTPNAITDVADFAAFAAVYFNPIPYRPCFDYNNDGAIGLADFSIFAHDFMNSTPSAYCSSGW